MLRLAHQRLRRRHGRSAGALLAAVLLLTLLAVLLPPLGEAMQEGAAGAMLQPGTSREGISQRRSSRTLVR